MKQPFSFVAITPVISAAAWSTLHIKTQRYLAKNLAKLVLIIGLSLLLVGGWCTPVALAKVQFLKRADQWVYQAQHVLIDTDNHIWEVSALKPMEKGSRGVYLQLVTQSQSIHLDASQPLILNTASGTQLSAPNMTRQYFIGALPEPNVGHYDIQALLPQLKDEHSLQLQLPTQQATPVTLSISSDILEEWITVGACQYLICAPFHSDKG